jgi:hypothetical protein
MPAYPFDQNLISSVLADPAFQRFGIYNGEDRRLFYSVADPRRRTVNVWVKDHQVLGAADWVNWVSGFFNPFVGSGYQKGLYYRLTAVGLGHAFFTNGPMMTPSPSRVLPWWARAVRSVLPMGSLFGDIRWVPMNAVVKNSRIIDRGIASAGGGGYFLRTGAGQFGHYRIGPMPTQGQPLPQDAIEGIFGLTLIVSNRRIVRSPSVTHLQDREGVAVWAKVPIDPAVRTDEWESETPYLPPGEEMEAPANAIDGVIVAAGSGLGNWNNRISRDLVLVGATDAVAMDPSDSVICGSLSTLDVQCAYLKDLVQEYGLSVN